MKVDRWYVLFGGVNVIVLLPPHVTEARATETALKQAKILEAESATLKSTKRMYDDIAQRVKLDSPDNR